MDYVIKSQTAEFCHMCSSLILATPDLLDELAVENKFLVDAGVSYRDFWGCSDYTYAVEGVKKENEGWANFLEEDHFLKSYTREDFRANSGLRTLTAFDVHGPEATVYYNTEADVVTCGHCGAPTSVSLTSGGTKVYVCQTLSSTDFSLLVRGIAFPRIFTLLTNEGCLGWSSAPLNSWLFEKHVLKKWKIIYRNKKNNVSVS